MKRYLPIVVFLSLILGFSACKKDNVKPNIPEPEEEEVFTKEDTIKDSVFYYAKLLSLWQDYLLPRNINDLLKEGVVRSYTKHYKNAEEVLDAQLALTPTDPSSGKPIDRFSFLDRAGVVSGEIQGAVATSFGMYVFYLTTQTSGNDAYLYVRMVDKNSPAYHAGIQRGDRILSINGNANINYNAQLAENFKSINTYLGSSSLKVKFAKPTGSTAEKEIASVQYNLNPVLDNRVIDHGGKKVGYLAFSSFVNIQQPSTGMLTNFNAIFDDFESKGVNELIVDLRYNGGGAVVTAEYLADRIAPAAADKQLMYHYEVNNLLKSWGWLEEGEGFEPVYFAKKGNLNLPRVYFLVTRSTASASELLINSLKPYMDVYLVGTYSVNSQNQQVTENTYGKPVGFFGLPIVDDDIELYVSSFKMYNADEEGDYFAGIEPDGHVWEFSNFRDFGDKEEPMIASALQHIQTGSFTTAASRVAIASNGRVLTNRAKSINLQENNANTGMFKFQGKELKK